MKRLLLFLMLGLLASGLKAQVRVYPTFVAINPNAPIGNLVIENPANTPVEVRLSFVFAYERLDPKTGSQVVVKDTSGSDPGCLNPYVKVFPQRFILPPGGRQEVRILSRVPAGSTNLLWTKLLAESHEQIRMASATSGISANVRMLLSQLVPVYFTGSRAQTSISLVESGLRSNNGKATLSAKYQRSGDNPFVGTINLRVVNEGGKEVASAYRSMAIFYDAIESFDIQAM